MQNESVHRSNQSDETRGRGAAGLADQAPEDGRIQEYLTLEVTTVCDNIKSCNYCFALANLPGYSHMEPEIARAIVREGHEIGYRMLHFTGGEPTLWPRLYDLMDYALELGYDELLINTHAMGFRRERWDRLAQYRANLKLTISLNGPRELHDASRGPGTFDRTRAGIREALNRGIPVELFVVIGRRHVPSLASFIDESFREFPELEMLTLIQLHRVDNDEEDVSQDLMTPEDFVAAVRAAAIMGLLGHPIRFLDNPLAAVVAGRTGLPMRIKTMPLLRPGRLTVLRDGSVTGAHSDRGAVEAFRPGGLRAARESDAYSSRHAPDETICPSCEFLDDCRAHGMLRPSEWHRQMESDEPFCKKVNRAVKEFEVCPTVISEL